MKRKLSVAFVLTILLVLLVIGALAAVLLSGKDFVDTVLAPKAAENQSDRWTQAEIQDILRIGNEHGLTLEEETVRRLQQEDRYWKEELMRLYAKLELGFYPGTWSLEDQVWYDQMLVDTGIQGGPPARTPRGERDVPGGGG